ncbi:N-acetylglucosamine-specific PTS transporter subunit IIBC [Thermoflavimicrobium dichotomicum]|uniref:PTS system, N-acetylglucosamine-specific IIC component n=1 Tax=Thermoflavimicrobium dichotomicum TaxID=46223 RepID=A0A1I3P332_9BACL|nr:N-acetylglucosamine-specific PTS transporter subunit IIBC [Thermoflavimicrobium dichotomicum]SFJ15740.1 PTS system, N-acetylglucosamine-specific IIC component [Thermoflavimicrobium dichotomicum]
MLAFLQRVGKSLMLPIAALPAAGLLIRFGAIDYVEQFKMGETVGGFLNHYVAPILAAGGGAIFDNLPLLFAIGIAIGFARDAVATLAAVIAHFVLINMLAKVPLMFPFIPDKAELKMGVLGGILAGGVASYLYKKYHDIKLPDWLGFFGGKRFVPIVTSIYMVIIGLLVGMIWSPIQDALSAFGNWIVSQGAIGAGLFGFFNRLLIPLGLHHVLNTIAWFQIGDFVNPETGKLVQGDLNRFFAGDPNAGMFMTGFFPIMMFALPAACLAMIHTAKPEKRKLVSSILISAAITAFVTGVTEPIEFAFMFVAPVLYVIHAILTGVAGIITTALDIHSGFTFSAGLIDFVLSIPIGKNSLWLIPIGLAFAIVYYFLFRFLIIKFDLKTPGREDDDVAEEREEKVDGATSPLSEKATKIVEYIGGKENIKDIDACITRLRLVLHDPNKVDEKGLKSLGAAGIIKPGQGSVQIVFGTESERLKDEILKL